MHIFSLRHPSTMKLSTPLLSLTIWSSAHAFAPSRSASSFQALNVGVAMDWNDQDVDETLLMKRAEACANSDVCSLDETRTALDDVIHVLSGCISGTVLGSVCENVDTAADVVARLREKITIKTKKAIAVGTSANLAAVSATLICMAMLASGLNAAHVGATPFTAQEWWWSVRDGYLPQMMSEYFQYGGLATADSYDSDITAFTLQEIWWAAKGGYLNNLVDHFVRNGGLATGEGYVPEATSFTLSEWRSALQGGYLDEMFRQHFRYGGLATGVDTLDLETIKTTPQELFWAARDGYIADFQKHVTRNGGV